MTGEVGQLKFAQPVRRAYVLVNNRARETRR